MVSKPTSTMRLGRMVWRWAMHEGVTLLLGILVVTTLLALPAGGTEAIRESLGLLGRALQDTAGQESTYLADTANAAARGSLLTFALTLSGVVLCVSTALGLTIEQETRGRTQWLNRFMMAGSAIPSFLWWVFFVGLGRLFEPDVVFVYLGGRSDIPFWHNWIFWVVALGVIAFPNGSFIAAKNALDGEMHRIRAEPYAVAARVRGLARLSFYLRHLSMTALSVGLERLGGILGTCILMEMLMNIPGLGWQGFLAFNAKTRDYLPQWIVIVVLCLVFIRLANIAGRILTFRIDVRLRRNVYEEGM